MKRTICIYTTLIVLLGLPYHRLAQGTVQIERERHVIAGYMEPNTPGTPGVAVDPALAAAITDPAAFDANGSLDLNKAIYYRYFDRNRSGPPDAIVIMIPGLLAGANSSSLVASEIVRLSGGQFEVWAVDRRANLLEDLNPMISAQREMTKEASMAALDAHVNNPAGRGGYIVAHPFSVSSFMSEWGLDVQLRDLRVVVDEARRVTGQVFLGGHSLGAVLAQMFAAYDFGDTAGFQLIKGIILLDLTADPAGLAFTPISDEVYMSGGEGPLGEVAGLNQLRNPTAPEQSPFATYPMSPFFSQLVQIGAQLALVDPDGPSPLGEFLSDYVRVPATNAAAMGIAFDDEFQELGSGRWSIGFLRVPPGGTADDVATWRKDPEGINPNGLWTPKNLAPNLQGWASSHDLSPLGLKSGVECSDLNTLMRMFLLGNGDEAVAPGDANFWEWFFPNRMNTDIVKLVDLGRKPLSPEIIAAQKDRGGNPMTMTANSRVNVPLLAVRNSESNLVPLSLAFQLYRRSTSIPANKITVATMENYAHGDMLTSLEKRSDPGNKNIPELIVDFVKKSL
jgi:pimeloyl-ACP methyl ester carboxylesterase